MQKLLMKLDARTPQEFDTINTQVVINIDVHPETMFEGHALRHAPNDFSAGYASQKDPMHASRHDPNDLSPGHASQQEPIISYTSNLISLNVLLETVPEGHTSHQEPISSDTFNLISFNGILETVPEGHASQQEKT